MPRFKSFPEPCADRPGNAVGRPFLEMRARCRMPVTRSDDRSKPGHPGIDGGDDGIASGDSESAAGAEVILDIDDEQRRLQPEIPVAHDDLSSISLRRRSNSSRLTPT